MTSTSIRTAVILAAGAGTKFWPYNVVRQKAAFPIANMPMVRRIADSIIAAGVDRIVVVTGGGEGTVRAALRGLDDKVRFVRQGAPDGTADALLHGIAGLDEDFLVVYGDLVTASENITAVIRRFEQERPLATALVQPLQNERPEDNIVAHVAGESLVGVEGHPRVGSHRIAGVFVCRSDAVRYFRANPGYMQRVPVGGMPPMESEIGQSLQMMVDDGERVAAVETAGYHVDVDRPWQILIANQACIAAMSGQLNKDAIPASASIHDGAEIHGRVVLGENAVIGNRVVVRGDLWLDDNAIVDNGAILEGPAVIGSGAKVRDYSLIGAYSSLGFDGIYGHGAEFTGVALDHVYCYHYCEIWGVVGHSVDFGAATVCGNLRFDDEQTRWRVKGRWEQPAYGANAAYFGDFSRTGVNVIIMPGRRIGVYSCVGAGVVVYEDVADRELLVLKQDVERKRWGPERYGW